MNVHVVMYVSIGLMLSLVAAGCAPVRERQLEGTETHLSLTAQTSKGRPAVISYAIAGDGRQPLFICDAVQWRTESDTHSSGVMLSGSMRLWTLLAEAHCHDTCGSSSWGWAYSAVKNGELTMKSDITDEGSLELHMVVTIAVPISTPPYLALEKKKLRCRVSEAPLGRQPAE